MSSGSIAKKEKWWAYLFILPGSAIILIFWLIPSFYSVFYGFFHYDGIKPPRFAGLDNYTTFFLKDPRGLNSLKIAFFYSAGTLPACLFAGFALAIVFNKHWFKGGKVYSAIYFLPRTISYAAISFVWCWLLDPMAGIINYVLESVGLEPIFWLGEPLLALVSILIVSIWRNLGFFVILYLSALKSIPSLYLEAAELDGASEWQKTWHVIWPLVRPTTTFVVILAIIDAFKVFDQVYVLTFGGPAHSTEVVAFYVWHVGFVQMLMGYSSAIATVLLIIMLALTTFQWKYYLRKSAIF